MKPLIVLKGMTPDHVSREQVRAFLHASVTVLSYHNRPPLWQPLVATVARRLDQPHWIGQHCQGAITLRASNTPEEMLTACLHEVIHGCVRFPAGTLEKCTSTLTARLKPDVARLADVLLEGTYRRAAYLAHTRLSYRAEGGDHYDNAQHAPAGVRTRYRRETPR